VARLKARSSCKEVSPALEFDDEQQIPPVSLCSRRRNDKMMGIGCDRGCEAFPQAVKACIEMNEMLFPVTASSMLETQNGPRT
jgi:hypothetical protein